MPLYHSLLRAPPHASLRISQPYPRPLLEPERLDNTTTTAIPLVPLHRHSLVILPLLITPIKLTPTLTLAFLSLRLSPRFPFRHFGQFLRLASCRPYFCESFGQTRDWLAVVIEIEDREVKGGSVDGEGEVVERLRSAFWREDIECQCRRGVPVSSLSIIYGGDRGRDSQETQSTEGDF